MISNEPRLRYSDIAPIKDIIIQLIRKTNAFETGLLLLSLIMTAVEDKNNQQVCDHTYKYNGTLQSITSEDKVKFFSAYECSKCGEKNTFY